MNLLTNIYQSNIRSGMFSQIVGSIPPDDLAPRTRRCGPPGRQPRVLSSGHLHGTGSGSDRQEWFVRINDKWKRGARVCDARAARFLWITGASAGAAVSTCTRSSLVDADGPTLVRKMA